VLLFTAELGWSLTTPHSLALQCLPLIAVSVATAACVFGFVTMARDKDFSLGLAVFVAVFGYLTLCSLFAHIYDVIQILYPAASKQKTNEYAGLLYFSVMTQSTVGYGDIAPATLAARLFAAIQAIGGLVTT
jgi:hypothetical protein